MKLGTKNRLKMIIIMNKNHLLYYSILAIELFLIIDLNVFHVTTNCTFKFVYISFLFIKEIL